MPKYEIPVKITSLKIITIYADDPTVAAEKAVDLVNGWEWVEDADADPSEVREVLEDEE